MKRTAVRLILLALIALAGVSLAGIITIGPGSNQFGSIGPLVAAVAATLFVGTIALASWRRMHGT
jgi:hypothetical protein